MHSKRYGSIDKIGAKTANRCHLCHEKAHPEDYGSPSGPLGADATTIDHLEPQSFGGDDDPDNLRVAHAGCNSYRGTRPVEDVRLELAGTTSEPWSSFAVTATTTTVGAGLGAAVGGAITKKRTGAALGALVGGLLGLMVGLDRT